MDMDWQHYHRLNVTLLSVVGLWPYGNKFLLRFKRLLGTVVTFCSFISQVMTFFTVDYTRRLLLRNLPTMLITGAVSFKYISFLVASDSIKKVTDTINGDWKKISCKEETRIIQKYIEKGKFYTMGFSMFICPLAIPFVLSPLFSVMLDIVMPLNESRSHSFMIMFEIFVDQKKHFLLLTFIFDGIIVIVIMVFLSTEAMFMVYIQHICALFEVTSRRIKRLLSAPATKDSKRSSNVDVIRQVADIHCRAIRHCKTIRDDFAPPYAILIVLGILTLGVHLFLCTQTFFNHEFRDFLISGMFCLATISYMFYLNFVTQNVLNSSADVFHVLYETDWYNFPTSKRKLILFFMLNTIRPATIDVYSVFVPSYEGFSLIVRMTMSYATALFSLQ